MSRASYMLNEFHVAFGQPFGHGDIRDSKLRIRLHREETQELIDELERGDLLKAARELGDVVYVAYGTAHSLGIPLDAVLEEIHRAAMSKMGPDGPELDADGKVLKGPNFRPPDIPSVMSADLYIGWCSTCRTHTDHYVASQACCDCGGTS